MAKEGVPPALRVVGMQDWINRLDAALGKLGDATGVLKRPEREDLPVRVNAALDQALEQGNEAYQLVHQTRDEINFAVIDQTRLKEALEAMKANAEFRSIMISSMPKKELPGRLSYLGTALLAAGSGAFLFEREFLFATVLLWIVGLGLLLYGLHRTNAEDRERWKVYDAQFPAGPP